MFRIALLLTAAVAVVATLAGPALAQNVERVHGHDRVATAVTASRAHHDVADEAVLATADAFADAVASTALAARASGPVLLTEGDRLPPEVEAELQRLGVRHVWVLGGTHAVPSSVTDQLTQSGYAVSRLSGDQRYATARKVAVEAGPSMTGEVVVALGHHRVADRAWPDAIAAATLAAGPDRIPTLLTRPDRLPRDTEQGLMELGATTVVIPGGPQGVSEAVEQHIRDLGYEVERVGGASRYRTSMQLAERVLARLPAAGRPLVTASGAAFPDAVSAGAVTAAVDGVFLLVPPNSLQPSMDRWLRDRRHRFSGGIIVGGPQSVDELVVAQMTAAFRDEPRPEPAPAAAPGPAPAPAPAPEQDQVVSVFEGTASWYGGRFAGRTTACGETFDPSELTAAHRTLPCNTQVRVTNLRNGARVTVRVNDRGPYIDGRVIDLSELAAATLGYRGAGVAPVRGEVLEHHSAAAAQREPVGPGITHPDRGRE